MRTFTIGDIHGCSTSFKELIKSIDLQPSDTLVLLGDYVDRGPDSRGVIEYIIELQRTHKVIALRGNHEVLLMGAVNDYAMMQSWCRPEYGGSNTMVSYGITDPREIPEEHLAFIYQTQRYHETSDYIFVHANVDPAVPMLDQRGQFLFWERFGDPTPHISGKTVICGHSAQSSGLPKILEHSICIDTCIFAAGWLTCLEPETGSYWQTNEMGASRKGNLSEL